MFNEFDIQSARSETLALAASSLEEREALLEVASAWRDLAEWTRRGRDLGEPAPCLSTSAGTLAAAAA